MNDTPEDLRGYLDRETGPYLGRYPVNAAMIGHWCEAMGDRNPIYTDEAAARAAGLSTPVAPPAMLQAWVMPGPAGPAPGSDTASPFAVFDEMDRRGCSAIVAVNCEQEYLEPVQLGDELRFHSRIESISAEKATQLGAGHFITQLCVYRNQRDEVVARMRFRVLKYRPRPPGADERPESAERARADDPPASAKRMRPVRNRDNAFFWEGADAGELRVQRCGGCARLRHPPAPMCPHCQSLDWEAERSAGRGAVYSYTVLHHPRIPPFDYPNVVALVELDEGFRLLSNLAGVDHRKVRVGMRVAVSFEQVEPGLSLPLFRPDEPAAGADGP